MFGGRCVGSASRARVVRFDRLGCRTFAGGRLVLVVSTVNESRIWFDPERGLVIYYPRVWPNSGYRNRWFRRWLATLLESLDGNLLPVC